MDLETRKEGSITLLKPLFRNFDSTISKTFKGQVIDLINQGNIHFVLNLANVDFIDSSGLGTIISLLKTIALQNGNIVLCEAKTPVINLLNLTRMNRVFQMFPSEKEALTFISSSKISHV